jgi:hypothetical protein
MYCPNCGQAQTSDEIRYCSRCGLSLWELARWLTEGANAPWQPVQPVTGPTARRKGIRRAAKLLFLGGVLLPVALLLAIASDEPGFLVIPSLIIFVGLVVMGYCRLFIDDLEATRKQVPAQAHRPNEYLPPAQANPVNVLRPREPNTAEIVRPQSVTEYTTNLLRKRDKT